MRIKAVRASNSDSGGRRRRRGGTKWGWRVVGRWRRAINDVLIDFLVFGVQGSARKLKWKGGDPQGCGG